MVKRLRFAGTCSAGGVRVGPPASVDECPASVPILVEWDECPTREGNLGGLLQSRPKSVTTVAATSRRVAVAATTPAQPLCCHRIPGSTPPMLPPR